MDFPCRFICLCPTAMTRRRRPDRDATFRRVCVPGRPPAMLIPMMILRTRETTIREAPTAMLIPMMIFWGDVEALSGGGGGDSGHTHRGGGG
jgi:hypothetical protein